MLKALPSLTREAHLKTLAREIGFDACRITSVEDGWNAGERLEEYITEGRHGDMAWMEDTLERRKHPRAMWPDARSAVVVAINYGPNTDPLAVFEEKSNAGISVYAQGKDYHVVLKKRLKRLARAFARETGEEVKVFVDTAPLMEKPLAEQSGMGWQGKHTNLVSRDHGSWLFLGVMLTAARLKPDPVKTGTCGSCTACLDACPTKAFPAPFKLDARRCISYLTIENKGPIPREFRKPMGNRVYGCDDCLSVCPWNKFATEAREAAFHARDAMKSPPLAELLELDDANFRERHSGSPIKRIGRDRFVRNALIAAGNSGDDKLIDPVLALQEDDSPLVRGAAIWALARLDPSRFEAEKAIRMDREADPSVREEWQYGALD
ncbi:MAG: tRNA epoxyqueuosine(34) reductase QueG [Pseudomonadota bacterium]